MNIKDLQPGSYRVVSGNITPSGFPTQQDPEQKKGFMQTLVQGITSPFRRAGVQVYNAGSGLNKAIFQGDIAGANAELDKTRNLGYFGETKPTLTNSSKVGIREGLDIAGQGIELGSFFTGAGGAAKTAGIGFKGLVKESAKQGLKTGVMAGTAGGLGVGLQNEDATLGSVAGSTALGGALGGVGGAVFGGATGAIGAGLNKVTQKLSGNYAKQADDAISYAIERGIKPSVSGKKTPELYNAFMDKSKTAVKYIAENADDLNLTDDAGAKIKYPRNLDQFSNAISRAKQHVFGRYNFLKQAAGEDGARVYLGGVSTQLRKAADNTALKLKHPEVVAHLLTMADRFDEQKFLSAPEADDLIRLFNTELKAFYRNPQSGNANKMTVDAMIANNIRRELDDVIQNASGQNYQALKNTYGALSELEKEVAHRTVVANRANIKGLADLTDIFSGSQVIQGILNTDPTMIAAGGAQKMIANAYKAMNDPNRIIRNMFKAVGDAVEKSSKRGVKLTPSVPIKTMKALPPGRGPMGKQPSVDLDTINLPSRSQSTIDVAEVAGAKSTRVVRPKGTSARRNITIKSIEGGTGKTLKGSVKSGGMKDPLLQEAKKYKTAEEFVNAQGSKYKGVHEAPTRADGDSVAPAHALDKIYPADIYSSKATQYYSSGMDYDAETISILQRLKGKPNATIKVYRAVPGTKTNAEMIAGYEAQKRAILKNGRIPDAEMARKYNLKDSSAYYDFIDNEIQRLKGRVEPKIEKYAINEGDWVTPNRKYAVDHGMSNLGGNYKILSKKVRADELFTDANSIQEFGYSPRKSKSLSKSQLTDIWNKAQKLKKKK